MLIMAPKAKATTYDISPSSACTLYDAIDSINNKSAAGDCAAGESTGNTINLAAGTYQFSGQRSIYEGANFTMKGAGVDQTIIEGLPDEYGNFHAEISITGGGSIDRVNMSDFTASSLRLRVESSSYDPKIKSINMETLNKTNNISPANGNDPVVNISNVIFTGNFNGSCLQHDGYANNYTVNIETIIVKDATNGGYPCLNFMFQNNGRINIENSSFFNNQESTDYGLSLIQFYQSGENITATINANLTNNTFSNNKLAAIKTWANANANVLVGLINNTIAGTSKGISSYTDPIEFNRVTYNLTNNIFNNTDGNCPPAVDGLTINSNGGNIAGDASCDNVLNAQNDKKSTDPLLQPLTTQFPYVMPITQSSPAFNNGVATNAPATDQRGIARPQGGAYDSGAYELIAATPDPASNTNSLAKTGNDARIPALVASLMLILGLSGFMVASRRR